MHKELVYIKGFAKGKEMNNTVKAVALADRCHKGQKRKTGEDYVEHPMRVAKQLISLKLYDDELIAAALLHDIIEDCNMTGASLELVVSKETVQIVELLTKRKHMSVNDYYNRIKSNPKACLVKISDRCHNLSTMADAFTKEKIESYIYETKEHVFPICKHVIDNHPEYSDEVYAMRYHMESIIETIEVCLKALTNRRS